MQADLERILFDEPEIQRRVTELAQQIANDYADRELTVVALLNGSLMFAADLLRRISLPLHLHCLTVASYHGKTETSGEVTVENVDVLSLVDRDVLIVDDILDSGHTLAAVCDELEKAKPRSIRICVLLRKRKRRARRVDADYVGFEMKDEFVVGYGLDFMGRYRNLPSIGVLTKGALEQR